MISGRSCPDAGPHVLARLLEPGAIEVQEPMASLPATFQTLAWHSSMRPGRGARDSCGSSAARIAGAAPAPGSNRCAMAGRVVGDQVHPCFFCIGGAFQPLEEL